MPVTFNSTKSIQRTVFVNELEITDIKLSLPTSGEQLSIEISWEEGNIVDGAFVAATSHRRGFTLDDDVANLLNAPLTGNTTVFAGLVEVAEAMLTGASSSPPGASSRRAFPVKP